MRAVEFTKRKLVLQDRVWRRQRLKTKSVWRLSEVVYQKLTSSESEEPSEAGVHQSMKTGS